MELWIEFLMVPIFIFITMLKVTADKNENYRIVSKFLNAVLLITGLSFFPVRNRSPREAKW